MNFVYFSLISAFILVYGGICLYYCRRYGGIPENSFFNKYKPSKKSILIRLKLFKYDNNFNYFLLIPYILVWNISLSIIILYIIYWCGIKELKMLFINKWFNLALVIFGLLIAVYGGMIDWLTLNQKSYDNGRDFIMKNEKEKTKDDEDKD